MRFGWWKARVGMVAPEWLLKRLASIPKVWRGGERPNGLRRGGSDVRLRNLLKTKLQSPWMKEVSIEAVRRVMRARLRLFSSTLVPNPH